MEAIIKNLLFNRLIGNFLLFIAASCSAYGQQTPVLMSSLPRIEIVCEADSINLFIDDTLVLVDSINLLNPAYDVLFGQKNSFFMTFYITINVRGQVTYAGIQSNGIDESIYTAIKNSAIMDFEYSPFIDIFGRIHGGHFIQPISIRTINCQSN